MKIKKKITIFSVTKFKLWGQKSAQWNIPVLNCFCWVGSLMKKEIIIEPRWICLTWVPFRGGVHTASERDSSQKNSTRETGYVIVYQWPKQTRSMKNWNIWLSRFSGPYLHFCDTLFSYFILYHYSPPPQKKKTVCPLSSPSAHSEMSCVRY